MPVIDESKLITARVFDIQRWSLHDGPGIRTVVFLKGCPLLCQWCSNPESQAFHNELGFFKDKCISCSRCASLCPHQAITIVENHPQIDRTICEAKCYSAGLEVFPCTAQCYSKALRSIANLLTVEEVMAEVMKDEGIYRESEVGGVTVSGGEPLSQADFVRELFTEAKRKSITTAIETCGYVAWSAFNEVIPHTDYMYFDIKAYDSDIHTKLTGMDNTLILENALKASKVMKERGGQLVVRIPIIPVFTEEDDFVSILNYVRDKLEDNVSVELMPYHRLGRNKYTDLGRNYPLMDLLPCSDEDLAFYREIIGRYDFPGLK